MTAVLLVHPDAPAWVQGQSFDAEVTPVATAQAARAYLAGTPFGLVLIGPDVVGAEAIAALRDVLGLATPVERIAGPAALAERLGTTAVPSPPASVEGETSTGAGRKALETVRDELSRVAHALNNPLAVVAGNAQLGLELARAMETDEAIVEALQNVVAAASDLEALFADVARLRRLVDGALAGDQA